MTEYPITRYCPQGLEHAKYIIDKAKGFFIYYDTDIDGGVSGELFRRYAVTTNKKYQIHINENRQHGMKLSTEQLEFIRGSELTIVMVDAGIERSDMERITSMGIDIVNIDHHDLEEKELYSIQTEDVKGKLTYGVIINNQYPNEPEEMRYLSGGGMVYHVIEYLNSSLQGEDEKVLVGLSLLSDIRPLENPYAKEFLTALYNHDSPMTEYLVRITSPDTDYGFGKPTLDRNYIDYTFSPKINALFRMNKGYQAIAVFNGTFVERESLAFYREEQNRICSVIRQHLEGYEMDNIIFKGVKDTLNTESNVDITNFIGLACSQEKGENKTTILYVTENGRIKRGSLRGLCDDVDYLQIVRDCGFEARGHKNAFGILSVDLGVFDINILNKAIGEAEKGYKERRYTNRILNVENLSQFRISEHNVIADYNNYVRDVNRIYINYTGNINMVEKEQRGKAIKYHVDGMTVNCFDDSLTVENALIQPLLSRRRYLEFYMKPY